jgi:hypothetical protein
MSPNAGGGGGLQVLSQIVQLYTGAQINFGDLTPYLTYARNRLKSQIVLREPSHFVRRHFFPTWMKP